jgi:thioredoxin-related protein
MKKIFLLLLFLPLFAVAQKGMHFEHGLSWKQIQAKAKAENKYIFMDAFTTWCGPCKFMSANIFPMESVGNFFNNKFINVKVQLDTTRNDNDEIKRWYKDGHDIMITYGVRAFPTYLFFDPNGKIVHRAVGAYPEPEKFIEKAKEAMNPEKQYYVLLEQYKSGKKDPEFLRNLSYVAQDAYDTENMLTVAKEYQATQQDMFTAENIEFMDRFTASSNDPGFTAILNNTDKFDKIKGQNAARKKIVDILIRDEVFPRLFSEQSKPDDFKKIAAALSEKYPAYSEEVTSKSKVIYYQSLGDWNNFQTAIVDYMKKYGSNVPPDELNNFAWAVFEHCKDMTCVKEALEWSRQSFKDKENPMFIDTYANILYKMGKKEEAIKWQTKAIALAGEGDRKALSATLEKMKKGEKTWKD